MILCFLAALQEPSGLQTFVQQVINGLVTGSLFALIALGYSMVYGIIELINFAHGDLFMLGAFLALTLVGTFGLATVGIFGKFLGIAFLIVVCAAFCGGLNWTVDWLVYRPLRKAPKLAPLVSAIGVSFIFMNLGLFWGALPMDVFGGGHTPAANKDFPNLIANMNLLGGDEGLRFTLKDLVVLTVTIPLMIGLNIFVKYTKLGKAMRATAQNPTAAQLMGIDVNKVIGATFIIGGALAGSASVLYSLHVNTIGFQMGYQNGLYAFTAAVLGGIGSIPGAVLGGLVIGLVRSLGSQYVGEKWVSALVFAILIVILIFRPTGLMGSKAKEKV
jgi:branched-chain amino acid transport system permease protein